MRVSPILAAPWFLSTLHCFWSHLPGCLVPLCVRVHVHVPVSLCRPLCVCRVCHCAVLCLSPCPRSCLVVLCFRKRLWGWL